jgi:hypothetical protein
MPTIRWGGFASADLSCGNDILPLFYLGIELTCCVILLLLSLILLAAWRLLLIANVWPMLSAHFAFAALSTANSVPL